jgi:nucleoside-diphosphate-sugar epimerase
MKFIRQRTFVNTQNNKLPDFISSENELDSLLSVPSDHLIKMIKNLKGDILVLGAAGKMGFTLCSLAQEAIKRAGVKKKVIAVSRFSDKNSQKKMNDSGIKTISCDLLKRSKVEKLPLVPNVIYMAGKKFGTRGDEAQTWASNVIIPYLVANHFKKSRIVVFSTGCVYPLTTIKEGGCTEKTPPVPIGEYAQSCLGRERIFGYYSQNAGTPVCIFRLNYAVDLRYGVLFDIGKKIIENKPLDVSVPFFNALWQGDACGYALLCLLECKSPENIINVSGSKIVSLIKTAKKMAGYMRKKVSFTGKKGSVSYITDTKKSMGLWGKESVELDKLIYWQAKWLKQGLPTLNKPTHFEVSNGKY